MTLTISNVLAYSSINAEGESLESVPLEEVMKTVQELVHLPEHIELNVNKKLPKVIADRTRMQQLFQNLISNAVKYNDKSEGSVEVDYRIQDGMYLFSVKDNGMGIDNAYTEKIFGMFQRLDNDENSTGVGLSIVKRIVELYGGTIWVESEVGIGSTFYFTLPKP